MGKGERINVLTKVEDYDEEGRLTTFHGNYFKVDFIMNLMAEIGEKTQSAM